MVKLKYDRIGLAAIHAWMQCEVFPRSPLVYRKGHDGCCLNPGEVTLAISQVPEALVLDVAGLAPGLADASLSIFEAELIDGFLETAAGRIVSFQTP
jgi:hypothetical protein